MRFFSSLHLVSFSTLAFATMASAQVSVTAVGFTYEQNFDIEAGSSRNIPWTDNSNFPGWSILLTGTGAPPTQLRATNGISTSDTNVYHWRSGTSDTDHALGFYPQTVTDAIIAGVRFTNNTGQTLTSFTISYTGEQWRVSGPTGAGPTQSVNNQIVVAYKLGETLSLDEAGFTSISDLTFNSLREGEASSTAIDGNLPEHRTVFSPVTISDLNWAPGTDLWIRFRDADSTGLDQGMAIDDFSFSAIPEPSTYAMLTGLLALVVVAWRRRR